MFVRSLFLAAMATFFLSSCAVMRGGVTARDISAEYYAIAEAYAELAKYEKALPYYEKAEKQKEIRDAARYGRARMYAMLGKWTESCEILAGLLSKDPGNEMLETAYAFSLVSSGNAKDSLDIYRKVVEKRSDDPAVARNYAEVQIIAGLYSDALETIAMIKKKFPDSEVLKDLPGLEIKATEGLTPTKKESKKNGALDKVDAPVNVKAKEPKPE